LIPQLNNLGQETMEVAESVETAKSNNLISIAALSIEEGDEAIEEAGPTDFINYEKTKVYWSKQSATTNGMLGGYADINFPDIRASQNFLNNLYKTKPAPGRTRALDCGAGIGRVAKNLLLTFYDTIDLLEQDPTFAKKAEDTIAAFNKLGHVFVTSLQEFQPSTDYKYDLIWIQWVLIYLKDEDLVKFLRVCHVALNKNGVIVIKENLTSDASEELIRDEQDSSVTRPLKNLKKIIDDAGLRVTKELRQTDFPKCLFPVYMLALKPK
jgi:protein N-terminal methyltransferase